MRGGPEIHAANITSNAHSQSRKDRTITRTPNPTSPARRCAAHEDAQRPTNFPALPSAAPPQGLSARDTPYLDAEAGLRPRCWVASGPTTSYFLVAIRCTIPRVSPVASTRSRIGTPCAYKTRMIRSRSRVKSRHNLSLSRPFNAAPSDPSTR